MKKRMIVIILVLSIALCGCSAAETFERLNDVYAATPAAEQAQIKLELPDGAAQSVMSTDTSKWYIGENYEVLLETYESGDLNKTLQTVTGYPADTLTVMELKDDGFDRYLCAWSAVTAEGEKVGRCAVLDDGQYHYCLTVMVPAAQAGQLQSVIDSILRSYSLSL